MGTAYDGLGLIQQLVRERKLVELDQGIGLCLARGFKNTLLRGDTDFSQFRHVDRWHELRRAFPGQALAHNTDHQPSPRPHQDARLTLRL